MAHPAERTNHDEAALPPDPVVDASRMSFGDHLDELRSCLVRALLGVGLGTVLALYFGREILEIVFRPLLLVQYANGLQPRVQVLSPTGAFTTYLRLAFLSGLVLTMPWVLHQGWRFVSAGLYARERRFVRRLLPASMVLFSMGVLFLYFVVLPLVLHFFINFNKRFNVPELAPAGIQRLLLAEDKPAAVPTSAIDLAKVPVLETPPPNPQIGDAWVDGGTRRLCIQSAAGVLSAPLETGTGGSLHSEFALDYYISFVLMLALGFGLAFQTPIVVFFLAWSGLLPAAAMARGRRYVLFAVVALAAVMTPPDVISQLLLAGPMYALFELGLLVAKRVSEPASDEP